MFTFVTLKHFKSHISLLLVFAFMLGVIWQSSLVVNFYINRAEVTEKFCVNKDKPKMNCHGKCHLKKQLEKTTVEKPQQSQKLNLTTFLFLGNLSSNQILIVSEAASELLKINFDGGNENSFTSKTFLPPDFSV